MKRAFLSLFLAAALLACGNGGDGGDGDGDVDAGVGGDADAGVGADADVDGGTDADADQDAGQAGDVGGDEERDLSRCGLGTESCSTCHGTAESPAPPPDTAGRTETTEVTVGSHQAHVGGSEIAAAIACSECHVAPASVLDPGHCDSPEPAEVNFGSTASAEGTYPVWNRSGATCSMVYCHGATLEEPGSDTSPSWTDPSPMDCGSCHRANYHGQTGCSCHSSVWSNGQITAPSRHVNGTVDW